MIYNGVRNSVLVVQDFVENENGVHDYEMRVVLDHFVELVDDALGKELEVVEVVELDHAHHRGLPHVALLVLQPFLDRDQHVFLDAFESQVAHLADCQTSYMFVTVFAILHKSVYSHQS